MVQVLVMELVMVLVQPENQRAGKLQRRNAELTIVVKHLINANMK